MTTVRARRLDSRSPIMLLSMLLSKRTHLSLRLSIDIGVQISRQLLWEKFSPHSTKRKIFLSPTSLIYIKIRVSLRYYIINREEGAGLDERREERLERNEYPGWVLVKKGTHDVSLRTHDH